MHKKFYIETYGCQMNFSDSEIVASVMRENNYDLSSDYKNADVIFVNTCSVRDHAEQRVFKRLREMKSLKKKNQHLIIGVLGCMAERLKEQLLEHEKSVDLIVGPDAYRDIPRLIEDAILGQKAINVILSAEETYADVNPVRLDRKGVSAFISIMRGCENFCSYCVVPFTRGKERSRNPQTIVNEAIDLYKKGYREVTLLGQNVNSYQWIMDSGTVDFPELIQKVALINPLLRVRFATSHPKDMSDKLLETIAGYPNICRSVHLPVQSGSSRILKLMNRKYDRQWYTERIEAIRRFIPDCSISTDIICGFCSETEDDHKETLSLMEGAKYDFAYMFKYSERPGTTAAGKFRDDVPEEIKIKRLEEVIQLQQKLSLISNQGDIGRTFEVLVEGESKRSKEFLSGRTSRNKVVILPKMNFKSCDYVNVRISRCTAATLFGDGVI
ncbi:MAG: tRNA (N6-isopentenyl adenosine(37)-C2)-methylthiotransferase MiaB [Bacteroidota bacterium]